MGARPAETPFPGPHPQPNIFPGDRGIAQPEGLQLFWGFPKRHPVFLGAFCLSGEGYPVFQGSLYLPGGVLSSRWQPVLPRASRFPGRLLPRARFWSEHWRSQLGSGRLGNKTRTPMAKRNPEKVGRTHAMRGTGDGRHSAGVLGAKALTLPLFGWSRLLEERVPDATLQRREKKASVRRARRGAGQGGWHIGTSPSRSSVSLGCGALSDCLAVPRLAAATATL